MLFVVVALSALAAVLYGYTVTGPQLKLRFIKFVQPSESEKQRLAYQKLFIMFAAAPYKKVGP